MTTAEFTAFYPQFAGFTPAVVLEGYIRQANSRFSSFSEEDAEEARRLYTAHKLTMYARVALPDNTVLTKAAIAAAGQAQQRIAMTMSDWIARLDAILTLNGRELLTHAGSISAEIAKEISAKQLDKFRERLRKQEIEDSLDELMNDLKAVETDKDNTEGGSHEQN